MIPSNSSDSFSYLGYDYYSLMHSDEETITDDKSYAVFETTFAALDTVTSGIHKFVVTTSFTAASTFFLYAIIKGALLSETLHDAQKEAGL